MHRFSKLSFIFLAMTFLLSPLALKAQTDTNQPKWTGVHVGVIGGAAAGNEHFHATDGAGATFDLNSSLEGGRVGIQGGWDFNFDGLVVGAVADWSWADAKLKLDEAVSGSFDETFQSTVKQMTTVRARVGKSYGRALPYVHGGLLVTDTEIKANTGFFSGTPIAPESHVHAGFVVGAGFEYSLARHYTVSTEYAYNHVSGIHISDIFSGGPGTTTTENPHFSTLMVGFNYRF